MQRHIFSTVWIALLSVFSFTVSAQDHGHDTHSENAIHSDDEAATHESADDHSGNDAKANKEFINHHLLDAHDFHITEGVSFPLPVILYNDGIVFFMSSEFHHGHELAEKNGKRYMEYLGKIYEVEDEVSISKEFTIKVTNAEGKEVDSTYVEQIASIPAMDFLHNYVAGHHNLENDTQEGAFVSSHKPLDLSITKNVFVIIIMSGFLLFVFGRIAKSYKRSPLPSGAGKFLEPIIIFVRDEIAIPNIGEKHYKKYMSYLLTVFFFIWFINLFGMFPLGINVTGNIAITFALAILTFVITQFTGKSSYWAHIFWMPGVPVPMKILLMPIELIGVFIKPFALMIRLYANMKAGHVVLMSLIAVMYTFQNWGAKGAFLGLTLVLSLLELLVAALQAYIFTMLTALYFGAASEEHGDH
jgi:F-type H+-transporting ATPase subunit a